MQKRFWHSFDNYMKKRLKKISENISFAVTYGRGFSSTLYIIFVTFLFPVEHLMGKGREKPISLSLVLDGKSFSFFVRDSSDIAVLKEVFLLGEYALNLEKDPDTIIDLGSNVGASVVYFALRYPRARIFAVEADPVTTRFLAENTQQFPLISVHNYAVSDTDGSLTFYVYPKSRMSSSLVRRTADQEAIQVPAIKFTEFLKKEGISTVDLLKFDIEGAEVKAFSGEGKLSLVKYLVGEIHLDLVGVPAEDVWDCFRDFSYEKQAISENRFIIRGALKV